MIIEDTKARDLQLAKWKIKRGNNVSSSQNPSLNEKTNVLDGRQAENKFSVIQPFCSIQAFNGLNEAHTRWGGQFTLISSRKTLTDTPRIILIKYLGTLWPCQADTKNQPSQIQCSNISRIKNVKGPH